MNFRLTGVLVLVAAVLVAGVYFFVVRRDTADDTAAATGSGAPVALFDLKAADVTRLKVADAGGKAVEVTKSGDAWTLAAPSQGPADGARVDSVVQGLAGTKASRKIEAPSVDKAAFGLDKPAYTITVGTAGGDKTLTVGGQTPDKSSNYVQKADDPAAYLLSAFTVAAATDLLTRPPVPPTPTPPLTVLPGPPAAAPTPLPTLALP